jgi:hypothetical protein
VTTDPGRRTGVAFDFPLGGDDPELDVAACIDWLRGITAELLTTLAESNPGQDSHGNHIVAATDAGWAPGRPATEPDQNHFSLLSLLLFGGGALWFEDVYTLTGYLLTGDGRHRLYVHDGAAGEVLGIDLPLTAAHGRVTPGFAGSLPQELASIIESRHVRVQPPLPADDYCVAAYDLTAWVDPHSGEVRAG